MVYIATWGDPLSWSIAEYSYGKDKVKCWTTLSLHKDRVILIVLYSAIFANPREDSALYMSCDKAREALSRAKQRENKGDEISEIVRDYFYDLLKCLELCNSSVTNVEVVPIPNLGRVSGASFEITTEALRGLLYAELYKRLKDEKEIVLDITHGLNYLTAIAMDVVQNLSALLGARLKVINAVPLAPKQYEIETVAKFSGGSFNIQDLKETEIIKSIRLSAPLPLIYLCKSSQRKFEMPKVEFVKDPNSQGGYYLRDKKVLGELKDSVILSRIVEDYVCERINAYDDPFKVDNLYEIAGLFERFYSISRNLIINELNNITYKGRSGMVYEIQGQPREDCESMMKSMDRTIRNFIAHAGFLKELTYFDNEKKRIYYKIDDDCYGEVLNKILDYDIYKLIKQ